MPVGARHHAVARLAEHERASERIVLEEQPRRPATLRPVAPLERAEGEPAHAVERHVAQDGGVHQLVHEPHLQRLPRADVPPREDHVEGALEPDEPRQPLRPAPARNDPELHLGEREHRLRVIRGDAVAAGERGLETRAEAGAVDRGDDRNAQRVEAREQRLAAAAQRFGIGRAHDREELVDVRAGDPRVGLPREEHHAAQRRIRLDAPEELAELRAQGGGDLVHGLAGKIDRDERDAVLELELQGGGVHARSTTIA
jgi:hypothetical protein